MGLAVGMSASSSTASIQNGSDTPEATTNAPSRSQSPSWEERSGGLPNISQVPRQRKVPPAAVQPAQGAHASQSGRDRDADVAGSEGEDPDDGTLLPPIGGIKGKRDSKTKTRTFKAAGAATLQKQTMTMHGSNNQAAHPLGVLGTSKGFSGSLGVTVGGASSGMSATNAMSSSHAQNWGGGEPRGVMGSSGSGHQASAAEKMNSTWAPNQHNSRKYVSPFSHKL